MGLSILIMGFGIALPTGGMFLGESSCLEFLDHDNHGGIMIYKKYNIKIFKEVTMM